MTPIGKSTVPFNYASPGTAERSLHALSQGQNPFEASMEFDKDTVKVKLNAIWISLGNEDLYHGQKGPKEEFVIALLDAFSDIATSNAGAESAIFRVQNHLGQNYQCRLQKNDYDEVALVEVVGTVYFLDYSQQLRTQQVNGDLDYLTYRFETEPKLACDQSVNKVICSFNRHDVAQMKSALDQATEQVRMQFFSGQMVDNNNYIGELARNNQFQLYVANKIIADAADHHIVTVIGAARHIVSHIVGDKEQAYKINDILHTLNNHTLHKMAVIQDCALFILNNKTLFTNYIYQCVVQHVIRNDTQYAKAIVQNCLLYIAKNPALFTTSDVHLALTKSIESGMPIDHDIPRKLMEFILDHEERFGKDIVTSCINLVANEQLSDDIKLKMVLIFIKDNFPFFHTAVTNQVEFVKSFKTPPAWDAMQKYSKGLSDILTRKRVVVHEHFDSSGRFMLRQFVGDKSILVYVEKAKTYDSLPLAEALSKKTTTVTLYELWLQGKFEAVLQADPETVDYLWTHRSDPALLYWNKHQPQRRNINTPS